MWVNPFWLGVLVTVIVEIVGILIAATVTYNKDKEHKR